MKVLKPHRQTAETFPIDNRFRVYVYVHRPKRLNHIAMT